MFSLDILVLSCGDQAVSPRLSLTPLAPTLSPSSRLCSARPGLAALLACGQPWARNTQARGAAFTPQPGQQETETVNLSCSTIVMPGLIVVYS